MIARFALTAAAALALSACGLAEGRDQIRVVGSSTIYPFAKLVSAAFLRENPEFKPPIIEANGTGAGLKLFCSGIGPSTPDIANASRRMTRGEFEACRRHGVTDIAEIRIGVDGLVFAAAKAGPDLALTPAAIYRALAASPFGQPNRAQTWRDVDPAYPPLPILAYGPARISGTRDAMNELVLQRGCDSDPATRALRFTAHDEWLHRCTDLRSDGGYADTSDNYNLIVQKLSSDRQAIGVFGFSYLEANLDRLKGLPIDGVMPTYETIASFRYPGARPLFIYVKKRHLGAVPGLAAYVGTWARNWGRSGPLARAGLIVLPEAEQRASMDAARTLPSLRAEALP